MAHDAKEGHGMLVGPNEAGAMPSLQLNKTEEALCDLLDDACRWIESTRPQPDHVESGGVQVEYKQGWTLEARIAGGWVRDKLLGYESHDLDISLSSLTGHIFALLLRSYLLSEAFAASSLANERGSPFHAGSSSSDSLVGHITRIAANPEQSKNLETATARVAGLQLDFVNLRKEIYVGSSRIPTMTFGTPHEDAERRDITINSLFFNIHRRTVEDYTGKGLADMEAKIIRTPLSPQRTFLDDPLRVLRCVRFASRFGYKMDGEIARCFEGGEGETISEALRTKVSRERFGIEVDKMMRGPDPKGAIDLIQKLNLFDVIFGPPPGSTLRGKSTMQADTTLSAAGLINELWKEARRRQEGKQAEPRIPDELLAPLLNEDSRRLLFYSAALLPLEGVEWEEKRGKWFWAGECVVFVGLKVSEDKSQVRYLADDLLARRQLGVNNTRKPLAEMVKALPLLERPVPEVFDASDAGYRGKHITSLAEMRLSPRATMALMIRQPCITNADIGLNLPLCLLWAMIKDSSRAANTGSIRRDNESAYIDFFRELQSYDLLTRVHEKPLLDGKEILASLEIKKASKDVQTILKSVEAWQFDRDIPAEKKDQAKEECKTWLKEEWARGGIIPMKRRAA